MIGSMDFRWTGNTGFEISVIPGGQGVFWQADMYEAHGTPRKATWSRWNVNHGERRTCVTKGRNGWKTHVPFHTYLPSTAKPLAD